jgi:hypothetical protein
VYRKLSDLSQENAFRRAINRVADADLILDLNKEVDECVNNFMVCQFDPIGSGLPVHEFLFKLGTQLSTGMDVKFLRKIPLV